VETVQPTIAALLLERAPPEIQPGLIEPVGPAPRVARPDQHRRRVGHAPEQLLAAAQGRRRLALLGHIPEGHGQIVDQAHATGADPALLAVDDPSYVEIVGPAALQQPQHALDHLAAGLVAEDVEHPSPQQGRDALRSHDLGHRIGVGPAEVDDPAMLAHRLQDHEGVQRHLLGRPEPRLGGQTRAYGAAQSLDQHDDRAATEQEHDQLRGFAGVQHPGPVRRHPEPPGGQGAQDQSQEPRSQPADHRRDHDRDEEGRKIDRDAEHEDGGEAGRDGDTHGQQREAVAQLAPVGGGHELDGRPSQHARSSPQPRYPPDKEYEVPDAAQCIRRPVDRLRPRVC
jgi:hypothetical protein